MKTLYVSDLDGTLLSSASEVSPTSRELLNHAIANGALFTVATARTPATVSVLLDGVDMHLPAVVMTGAALWDVQTHRYSDVRYIPRETVDEMIELYRHFGLPTFIYRLVNDMVEISHYGPYSEQEREFLNARIDTPFKHFDSQHCESDGMPADRSEVVLFYAMQPDDEVRKVYEILCRMPVTPLCYHDIFGPEISILEVFGPDTSKANAVKRLADRIGADRIVAFGDNINDLPMLEMADMAVAVGNAVDEVKEVADVVIGTNDSDAVARFILEDLKQ